MLMILSCSRLFVCVVYGKGAWSWIRPWYMYISIHVHTIYSTDANRKITLALLTYNMHTAMPTIIDSIVQV